MSYYFKKIQPDLESDYSSEEEFTFADKTSKKGKKHSNNSSDDEMNTLSFGSLKNAEKIEKKDSKDRQHYSKDKKEISNKMNKSYENKKDSNDKIMGKTFEEEEFDDSDSDSDNDGAFFEEEEEAIKSRDNKRKSNKGKHKHAPTETSSKKKVSRIRDIPGLPSLRQDRNSKSSLYQDIRFDKSMGHSTDVNVIRKRYKFLDEYRENEISELSKLLSDRKFTSKLDTHELNSMEEKLKSMKSRLQTIKNKELEHKILKDYEDKINEGNKGRYHLKESEKRKVVQKWKFDHMKKRQREKVMERKRKKRLGKEFKQFEFHQNRN